MAKKLYVGGLSYSTTESALQDAFSKAGTVASAAVIMDKMTGRSKGFGFVEMVEDADGKEAIEHLNDISLGKKPLVVKQAEDRSSGGQRGGGGGFNRRDNYNDRRRY